MKLTHRKIRIMTRLLLVVGLFAQGTLAAHACVTQEASAVKALSMQAGSECCHHAESTSANECLMHCTQAAQVTVDHHQAIALNTSAFAFHVAGLDSQHAVKTPVNTNQVIDSGPPLTIRFCTFLL